MEHAVHAKTLTTASESETLELGRRIARLLKSGMVLALHGDLGAGKTVLTRGVALGLGIDDPVTSPTFTVVQEYRLADRTWLFHLDMYRIDNEEDALAFGIEEYLFAADGITVVEWPERIAGLLEDDTPRPNTDGVTPPVLVRLDLDHAGGDTRRITLPRNLYDAIRPESG